MKYILFYKYNKTSNLQYFSRFLYLLRCNICNMYFILIKNYKNKIREKYK